jgi:diaminohydroxyphosphoribosylaminopyrimidine deaminase / 5-amino-6-(5-phosphoribosylamino)uracil reductase
MQNNDHNTHEQFMLRAMELALNGRGHVSPNPLVGSVVVHSDKIIGEGFHRKYGGPHAEVEAINSVNDKSLLRESTIYVNLEPCSHFGKTPPCADLIIREGLKRVVVSNIDPNPLVAGQGVKKLQAAGIEVQTGILENRGNELNKRFFTFIEKQRPYIILKWAETQDGFIARENFDSKWISSDLSRQLVHKWRTEEDAIMVGTQTAQYDNPQLNVRLWTGRDPVRVTIDRYLKLDSSLHLFNGTQKTIVYNLIREADTSNVVYRKIAEENFLVELLKDLHQLKIQSMIVEGGATLLQSFIDLQLWDEAKIFTSNKTFEKGLRAPKITGRFTDQIQLQSDTVKTYVR